MCAALGRHVRVSGCEDEAEREEFLIEHLGVPVAWIAEAKAARAKREGNHKVGGVACSSDQFVLVREMHLIYTGRPIGLITSL